MAWYYGNFACGCEGRVNIIGPMKNREWKKERAFGNLCEECYRKHLEQQRDAKNTEALAKAQEMELPILEGTEKQVAWANTLRNEFLEKLSGAIDDIKGENKYGKRTEIRKMFGIKKSEVGGTKEDVTEAIVEKLYKFEEILISKTKASYFIDKRYSSILDLIQEEVENVLKDKDEEVIKEEIIKETTVEPREVVFNGVVEIACNEDVIKVYYERNETFRSIVKDLGYEWNGCWEKKIKETTGSYIDRCAELANKLLNEGFRVAIPEQEIKEKALDGSYEHECKRWIYKRKDTKKLAINWGDYNNSLYNACKHLKGARWDSPSMLVDVKNYEQVEEFAEMYGFKFTKSALELIEQYKYELSKIEKVDVAEVEKQSEKNGLDDILNSSRDILADLAEED